MPNRGNGLPNWADEKRRHNYTCPKTSSALQNIAVEGVEVCYMRTGRVYTGRDRK